MMGEQKIDGKDYEFFILSAKEEDGKNVETTEKFIRYINENPTASLGPWISWTILVQSSKFPR